MLMVDVLPSIAAPKGAKARSVLGNAFRKQVDDYDPDRTHSSATREIKVDLKSAPSLTFLPTPSLQLCTC